MIIKRTYLSKSFNKTPSLCTVDFETQNFFAVSLTVERVSIMYVASSKARLSIYSFKKTPSLFHLLNNMNSKEKV